MKQIINTTNDNIENFLKYSLEPLKIPEKFRCQCKNGDMFDFRDRKILNPKYHAPSEGRCPYCNAKFSLVSTSYYPMPRLNN